MVWFANSSQNLNLLGFDDPDISELEEATELPAGELSGLCGNPSCQRRQESRELVQVSDKKFFQEEALQRRNIIARVRSFWLSIKPLAV